MIFLYISIDIPQHFSQSWKGSTAQLLLFAKIILKINGKFVVIIEKYYKESRSYGSCTPASEPLRVARWAC